MGFHPNSSIQILRCTNPRKIKVNWVCDVTGWHEKEFEWEQEDEIVKFVTQLFKERAM